MLKDVQMYLHTNVPPSKYQYIEEKVRGLTFIMVSWESTKKCKSRSKLLAESNSRFLIGAVHLTSLPPRLETL